MQYLALILELVSHENNKKIKVLDYGCRVGVSLQLLSSIGVDIVGFEPSPKRSGLLKDRGYIIVSNEIDLRVYGAFDIVICDNVLEHIPEPLKTIELFTSLCKQKSILYISVPSYENYIIKKQLRNYKKGIPLDMSLNPWEHLNYFSQSYLDQMLIKHGFVPIISCQTPGHVNIGLRPEIHFFNRFKNSLASVFRMIRYTVSGQSARSVNDAFYRFSLEDA